MKSLSDQTAELVAPVPGISSRDRLHLALDRDGDRFVATLYQPSMFDESQRSYPSAAAQNRFPARFPERKQIDSADGTSKWLLAATDVTANIIAKCWPTKQLLADGDALTVLKYLLLSGAQQDINAETSARYREFAQYKAACKIADPAIEKLAYARLIDRDYSQNPNLPLALYQAVALHNAARSEGYAHFLEQGAGKTPIIISEIDTLARDGTRCVKTIVVAPKNVRRNWQAEFAKFATQPGIVTVLRGGELERTKLIIDAMVACRDYKYSVVVCSYETMVRDLKILQTISWDMGVLDESHYIKSPQTLRAKAAHILREHCARRRVLTGTPVTNTILDLYSQLEFLGKGWSGFVSWKNFKEFYGVYDKDNATGHSRLVAIQNLPFMRERLARLSSIVSKKEALPDLPEKVYDVIEVEMSGPQQECYDRVAKELYYEIENDLANDGLPQSMMVNNILTKLLRLAQITSGFVTFDAIHSDDGEIIRPQIIDRFDPNPKIEVLVEALKDREIGSKTIIWACWRQDIKSIAARLKLEGFDCVTFYGDTNDADRAEAERRFNGDPGCTVFIGNPASGGTGLNLIGYPPGETEYTTNCDWEIYFSQNWSPVARSQSEDRAHRRGTRHHVRISDLCVANTIDEEIRARVVEKRLMAYEVADIREMLKRCLHE